MIALLALLATFAGGPPGPDGLPTVPGAPNPAVTQSNIGQTICVPGWSAAQRKLLGSHATVLKLQLMKKAGIDPSKSRLFELDHARSIEDGGSPTSPLNLWLQPYTGPLNAHQKDRVEGLVHRLICSGKITLEEGGREVATDWVNTYRQHIGKIP